MRFQTVNVTPKMAADWLTKNASNRGLSLVRVSSYARDMKDGHWFLNPQPIIKNAKGDLLDGQHRLNAIIEADTAVKMVLATGCDHEIRKYIDRGRHRTLPDRLKMEGMEGRVVLKASIARNLVKLDRGSTRDLVTDSEATQATQKYLKQFTWMEGATLLQGMHRASYVAVILWALPLSPRVAQFHEEVQSGVGLKEKSPAIAMRRFLNTSAAKGYACQQETILKTCNCVLAAIKGRSMSALYSSSRGYIELAKMLKRELATGGDLTATE